MSHKPVIQYKMDGFLKPCQGTVILCLIVEAHVDKSSIAYRWKDLVQHKNLTDYHWLVKYTMELNK